MATAACAPTDSDEPGGRGTTTTRTPPATMEETVGSATQEADGTIVLTLRATGAGGAVGDGQFRYPPDHPRYAAIRAHVGDIPKGGSVPVKPFPE